MEITRNTGTWNQNHRTETAYLRQQCLFFPKNLEPDRTRTGSVALSTKLVRECLAENVEALCCALLRRATLRCAVLFSFALLCSMLLRSVLFF